MMIKCLPAIFGLSCALLAQIVHNGPSVDSNEGRPPVRSYDWHFTDTRGSLGDLSTAGSNITVTLPCTAATPCIGLDNSNNPDAPYTIYISGTGTAEAATVTGGTCSLFAASSCTLVLATKHNHPNNYTLSSASGGVQEALNDATAKR